MIGWFVEILCGLASASKMANWFRMLTNLYRLHQSMPIIRIPKIMSTNRSKQWMKLDLNRLVNVCFRTWHKQLLNTQISTQSAIGYREVLLSAQELQHRSCELSKTASDQRHATSGKSVVNRKRSWLSSNCRVFRAFLVAYRLTIVQCQSRICLPYFWD